MFSFSYGSIYENHEKANIITLRLLNDAEHLDAQKIGTKKRNRIDRFFFKKEQS